MPELPEVECVARSLDSLLSGRSILTARLLRERLAPSISSDEFTQRLSAATIDRVHRRGKHILFDLDNGRTLVTHLRMSGTFMLLTGEREDPKFTHAVFDLADGNRLVFRDQRHFGFMNVVDTNVLFESRELNRLAPEPFSDSFTPAYVLSTSQRSKRNIKEVLLDQTKFCGLGNIYASESLHMARINPCSLLEWFTGFSTGS
jgi:formamidopyrimidine-DNA glycosylase